MEGRHWLVTGGLGFIGVQVVRKLLEATPREDEITVVDNYSYAAVDGYRWKYYGLSEHSRLRVFRTNICDHISLAALHRDWLVDYWIHLAAESHVDRSLEDAGSFVKTNVYGTQMLLAVAVHDWLLRGRPRHVRFCLVSTDEVYGPFDPQLAYDGGFHESCHFAPTNPYAATKAAAEHLTMAAHWTHGFPVVITRGSNTFGPLQVAEKFLPSIIGRAMQDRSLAIYGDGLYRRQWLDVEDHAAGIVAAVQRGTPPRAYNLGGRECPTNLEVAQWVIEQVGKGRIEHVADRPGHDRAYKIDFSRAETELGWKPSERSFRDQLRDLVQWHLENPQWLEKCKEHLYERKGLYRVK